MSHYTKLVVYSSQEKLRAHAANYPCLVNYNPFDQTGEFDDGVGHTSRVKFTVVSTLADLVEIAKGFDIVEMESSTLAAI